MMMIDKNLRPVFGSLLFSSLFLVLPVDSTERLNRLLKVCTSGLNLTQELIGRYQRVDFPDDPTTKCVMRCIGLNLGVYDDLDGVHIHDTWKMFRFDRDESEKKRFIDQHLRCIAASLASLPESDYCGKVYGTYRCFESEFQRFMAGLEQREAVAKRRNLQ